MNPQLTFVLRDDSVTSQAGLGSQGRSVVDGLHRVLTSLGLGGAASSLTKKPKTQDDWDATSGTVAKSIAEAIKSAFGTQLPGSSSAIPNLKNLSKRFFDQIRLNIDDEFKDIVKAFAKGMDAIRGVVSGPRGIIEAASASDAYTGRGQLSARLASTGVLTQTQADDVAKTLREAAAISADEFENVFRTLPKDVRDALNIIDDKMSKTMSAKTFSQLIDEAMKGTGTNKRDAVRSAYGDSVGKEIRDAVRGVGGASLQGVAEKYGVADQYNKADGTRMRPRELLDAIHKKQGRDASLAAARAAKLATKEANYKNRMMRSRSLFGIAYRSRAKTISTLTNLAKRNKTVRRALAGVAKATGRAPAAASSMKAATAAIGVIGAAAGPVGVALAVTAASALAVAGAFKMLHSEATAAAQKFAAYSAGMAAAIAMNNMLQQQQDIQMSRLREANLSRQTIAAGSLSREWNEMTNRISDLMSPLMTKLITEVTGYLESINNLLAKIDPETASKVVEHLFKGLNPLLYLADLFKATCTAVLNWIPGEQNVPEVPTGPPPSMWTMFWGWDPDWDLTGGDMAAVAAETAGLVRVPTGVPFWAAGFGGTGGPGNRPERAPGVREFNRRRRGVGFGAGDDFS